MYAEIWLNNTTKVDGSRLQRKVAGGSDVGAAAGHALVSMTENDFVTVRVANTTDSVNFTISEFNLVAVES